MQNSISFCLILKLSVNGYFPYFIGGRNFKKIQILNNYRDRCFSKIFVKTKVINSNISAALYIGPISDFSMIQRTLQASIPIVGVMGYNNIN